MSEGLFSCLLPFFFPTLLKRFVYLLFMCMFECLCVYVYHMCALGGTRSLRTGIIGSSELPNWLLGTICRSSVRAARTMNLGVVSPASSFKNVLLLLLLLLSGHSWYSIYVRGQETTFKSWFSASTFLWVWGSNSGYQACVASSLPAEPSCSSLFYFFKSEYEQCKGGPCYVQPRLPLNL